MQQYIREPTEIYKKSFDTITSEVDLTGYNDHEKKNSDKNNTFLW